VARPYTVHIQTAPAFRGRRLAVQLRAAAQAALAHQAAPRPGVLTIRLTDDAELRELNRTYLGHDYATDVLSFPADESEAGARYFGDLALSLPRAEAQAQAGGHPLEAELQLLVVHGVLHLLGHDHAAAGAKRKMWAAQAAILQALGAPITGPAPAPRPPSAKASSRPKNRAPRPPKSSASSRPKK